MDVGVNAVPEEDEVLALPGWDAPLPSRHFSGYLNASDTKHIHYYFVESEGDPSKDPVILWLNGGPGCSSLDGFFYEHGPFRIAENNSSQLVRFEHSWAKQANMLYLESPVGVGFSYSDAPDKEYGSITDDSAAEDNLHAVESFFLKFPSLVSHDFFITGESYAGVYVPTLAEAIVWAEGNGTYTGAKLKGIAVGNGCTGTEIGVCGPDRDRFTLQYLASTGFIPNPLKKKVNENCDFSSPSLPKACLDLIREVEPIVGPLNLYDVYGECISGDAPGFGAGFASETAVLKAPLSSDGSEPALGLAACINSISASEYVNRKDVIEAFNVKPISFRWAVCNTAPGWNYKSTRPNLPRDTYPLLLRNMRVIIYNGDFDACVPYTDNEAWTSGMGLKKQKEWHSWTYKNGSQIGGYATVYEGNLTFTTVRGGRHEVPETAPEKAEELIRRLIHGEQF